MHCSLRIGVPVPEFSNESSSVDMPNVTPQALFCKDTLEETWWIDGANASVDTTQATSSTKRMVQGPVIVKSLLAQCGTGARESIMFESESNLRSDSLVQSNRLPPIKPCRICIGWDWDRPRQKHGTTSSLFSLLSPDCSLLYLSHCLHARTPENWCLSIDDEHYLSTIDFRTAIVSAASLPALLQRYHQKDES